MNTLAEIIDQMGVKEFAEHYGIKERTVISYKYGDRAPRPNSEVAHKLIGEGVVTFAELYPVES